MTTTPKSTFRRLSLTQGRLHRLNIDFISVQWTLFQFFYAISEEGFENEKLPHLTNIFMVVLKTPVRGSLPQLDYDART